MSFVSNVIWLTVVLYTRLKPNGKFCRGLEGIECLECFTLFTEDASQLSGNLHLFCAQLCTVFRKTKVTVKNYLKESLLSLLCFIIHGQGSSEKGFKILTVRLKFI